MPWQVSSPCRSIPHIRCRLDLKSLLQGFMHAIIICNLKKNTTSYLIVIYYDWGTYNFTPKKCLVQRGSICSSWKKRTNHCHVQLKFSEPSFAPIWLKRKKGISSIPKIYPSHSKKKKKEYLKTSLNDKISNGYGLRVLHNSVFKVLCFLHLTLKKYKKLLKDVFKGQDVQWLRTSHTP